MTKLIIQIPAFNEEDTLAKTMAELPRQVEGISAVEWLIIDDGSVDRTVEVAKEAGADHIVSLHHGGLAKAFISGLEACLKLGADIVVNTDADNQYCAADIEKLVAPILKGEAEIVIGARPIDHISHFSWAKKLLQKLGSLVVRFVSNTRIPDAPSGFRAISKKAALEINIFNDYTYTLEMIIQAGRKNIPITSVPIRTNKDERPSRLVKSIPKYIRYSLSTLVRIFNTYRPLDFFMMMGALPLIGGLILGIRWIILFMGQGSASHLPSLILAAILILMGSQLCIFGLIADLISVNRKLLEDIQKNNRAERYQ